MARGSFGGGATEYVENTQGARLPGATVTLWSAENGGSQVTDLLRNAAAVTTLTAGTLGRLPLFSGPDSVVELWADGGGGVRTRLGAYSGDARYPTKTVLSSHPSSCSR